MAHEGRVGLDRPDRRRAPRMPLDVPVTVATGSEHLVSGGHAVDASPVGLLVAFPGAAVPIAVGDRCLVSLQLPDGALHLVAHARRRERGDDGRSYVGFEHDELPEAELARLRSA